MAEPQATPIPGGKSPEFDPHRREGQRRGWLQLSGLGLAGLVAAFLFSLQLSRTAIDFDRPSLGEDTGYVYGTDDRDWLHCGTANLEMLRQAPCRMAMARGADPAVVWLAASHLHTITKMAPGEKTAAGLLAERLSRRGGYLAAFSMGNANYQEMLTTYLAVRKDVKPQLLMVGAVLDDMREDGLRKNARTTLLADHDDLPGSEPLQRIMERLEGRYSSAANPGPANQPTRSDPVEGESYLLAGWQDRTERAINAWLEENWSLWGYRDQARGRLRLALADLRHDIGVLRHRLTGGAETIQSTVFPAAIYADNLLAFRALADLVAADGGRLLTYIAPRPPEGLFPYLPDQYNRFKAEMRDITEGVGGVFVNLEDSVAEGNWNGRVYNQYGQFRQDYFHFSGDGHAALAEDLAAQLTGLLTGEER